MVTGLDAVMVALPPATTPFASPLNDPPIDSAPELSTQVLPVVDVASICPTSVVMRLFASPMSLLANSFTLPARTLKLPGAAPFRMLPVGAVMKADSLSDVLTWFNARSPMV